VREREIVWEREAYYKPSCPVARMCRRTTSPPLIMAIN